MLNVDAAGEGAAEIAYKHLAGRVGLIGILRENFQDPLGPGLQACGGYLFRVFPRLPGADKIPTHQLSPFAHLLTGVRRPLRMDSLSQTSTFLRVGAEAPSHRIVLTAELFPSGRGVSRI